MLMPSNKNSQTAKEIKAARRRLGDILVDAGLLAPAQMDFVRQKQRVTGERFGELALRLGIVSEYDLARSLAEHRGMPYENAEEVPAPEAEVLALFNQEACLHHHFLPLRREGDDLVVLIGNADLPAVENQVARRTGLRPRLIQSEFGAVLRAIRHHFYFTTYPIEQLIEQEIEHLANDDDQVYSPKALLDYLLHLAVRDRATDVHIQPETRSAHIMFRVDGVLRPVVCIKGGALRLVSNIKMLAEMDISDQRRPQDGSFAATILDQPFDLRISTLVSEYGESVVIRLLPGGVHVRPLTHLGFLPEDEEPLRQLFNQPSGIVLLTGPTGSGKSTTLHAGLRLHGLNGRNVLTVEDPVEYKLPVICQTQVNRKAGYTFSSAITHFLRHDPDVMLIGEIRDSETANVAVTAAETGHLVLSTLHVNNAFGVIPRLRALGIHPQMIAESLIGVVSQRLLRKICSQCSEFYRPSKEDLLHLDGQQPKRLQRGKGCEHCGGLGYFGRLPIYEVLKVGRAMADAIAAEAPRVELERIALASAFKSMRHMAQQRVLRGDTTVEEMIRILGEAR